PIERRGGMTGGRCAIQSRPSDARGGGMGWVDRQGGLATGGGSGVGRAGGARAVEGGPRGGSPERGAARAAELHAALGDKVVGVAGDAASFADNQRAVAETVRAFGRLDIFVGNAGIFDVYASFAELPADKLGQAYDELFAVNVKGCLLGGKAALPELKKT